MPLSLKQRTNAFVQLGSIFKSLSSDDQWPGYSGGLTEVEFLDMKELIGRVHQHNGWFTPENVSRSLKAWSETLTSNSLSAWLGNYVSAIDQVRPATIAVICAGNIPMVGFHDILCTLLTGHQVIIKLSSDDDLLIPAALRLLTRIAPEMDTQITYATGKLTGFDAVIATGSNNTSRYFRQYFGQYPHIIRKSRTSAAVLTGTETTEELNSLGNDIFDYFGLGCRNVSRLFLPEGYDIDLFFKGIYPFHQVIQHNKYANNYDYNKAIWLLNNENLLDNGFILLKEDERLASPTGSLFYSYYSDPMEVKEQILRQSENIQCVAGAGYLPFGRTQAPAIDDYADGVDTLSFLTGLGHN
jgi:hypothetical protein